MHPRSENVPASFKWMSIAGVAYTITVLTALTLVTSLVTVPLVYSSSILLHESVTVYFALAVSFNLINVVTKGSIYNGPPLNQSGSNNATIGDALTEDTAAAVNLLSPHQHSAMKSLFARKQCDTCGHLLARRVHHCVLCQRCITKRDHHCFFTGCCVGLDNQRYFILFCWFVTISCMYCLVVAWQYLVLVHGHPSDYGYYHLILPLVIFEWLLGYASVGYLGCLFLLALCLVTAIGTTCVFGWQATIVATGQTTYEFTRSGGLRGAWQRPRCLAFSSNIRQVFGRYWALQFVVPFATLASKLGTRRERTQPGTTSEKNA